MYVLELRTESNKLNRILQFDSIENAENFVNSCENISYAALYEAHKITEWEQRMWKKTLPGLKI